MIEKNDEEYHKALIFAVWACLDPKTEAAPTVEQKQLVLDHFEMMGQLKIQTPYGMASNDLWLKEGKRSFALAVFDLIEQDPLQQPQEATHGRRTHRTSRATGE